MRARFSLILIALSLSTSCSTYSSNNFISPREAIAQAADAAPAGVPGKYAFTIRAIGKQDGYLYLNSELDYRDQRCLTIEINRDLVEKFEKKYPNPIGAHILVDGVARRVKILFLDEGLPSDRYYYYQTHVLVNDLDQIQMSSGG